MNLGPALNAAVAARLERMAAEGVVARLWARDHTIWKPSPVEIRDRLGWLDLSHSMEALLPDLAAFSAEVTSEGYTTAVLLGMGGSSLAPEVLQSCFGGSVPGLDLHVLDSTDPDEIAALESSIDLAKTLFIVASKSGGTIETASQFAYFYERIPDGRHFVAITDPGTKLADLARDHGFRRAFLNPRDIGGRYSALSLFGLVPAALIGVGLRHLLGGAARMADRCGPDVPPAANPGAALGVAVGEASLAGRDKLTLLFPPEMRALGPWIEQLVAESTGKEGRGILPVEGEPPGPPEVYGDDRMFVVYGEHAGLEALQAAGHPVFRLPAIGPPDLGAEVFRWELGTAVAGHVLGINPFDQPNVQEAKDRTAAILGGERPVDGADVSPGSLLAAASAGDYLAITAFLPRDETNRERLQAVRSALRDHYGFATTVGFGPRYLHSTGQLHKGGPNSGIFFQVLSESTTDLSIPGRTYSFRTLQRAQALGEFASLRAHGRRVTRVTMAALEALAR